MTCKYSRHGGATGCVGFRARPAPLRRQNRLKSGAVAAQKRRGCSHAPRRADGAAATSMNIAALRPATDAALTRRAAQLRRGRRVRRSFPDRASLAAPQGPAAHRGPQVASDGRRRAGGPAQLSKRSRTMQADYLLWKLSADRLRCPVWSTQAINIQRREIVPAF